MSEETGELDERFFWHYGNDDFCLCARIHGYLLLICGGDALVHYEESASFRREPELVVAELIWMNRQKFIDKLNADRALFM